MWPLLGLLVGAAAVLAGPGAGPTPYDGQSEGPIRVVSVGHEVRFPREIELDLVVESDADITEITLFYRRGQRSNVQVYGYPRFTPSGTVTAKFVIDTDGANFVPSGSDIEYRYAIRDARGRSLETPIYRLEYLDPAHEWHRLAVDDFTVVWHDRPEDAVRAAAADVAGRLASLKSMLDLEQAGPYKAVIFNSRAEADRSFPMISDAATRGHLYAGFAFSDEGVYMLVGLGREGMAHELAHLYVGEAVDSPFAIMPAWLNEGLATYFGSDPAARSPRPVTSSEDSLPLRSMDAIPGRPDDVRAFYAKAGSVVAYMMKYWGPESMAALLSAINDGWRVEDGVMEVYGLGLEELEQRWREDQGVRAEQGPLPDVGSLFTSILIASATAVAVLAFVLRHLRRRALDGADDLDN